MSQPDCEQWVSAFGGPIDPTGCSSKLEKQTSAGAPSLLHCQALAQFDLAPANGSFTKMKHLGDCGGGQVDLQGWHGEDVSQLVAVKKAHNAEDILNEVGIYRYLAEQQETPQYILKMHMAFRIDSDICLVLEHADGGDLFTVCQWLRKDGHMAHKNMMRWIWQLLQAIQHLHFLEIGHQDISLENTLLCHGDVRVMDFGQSVRTHNTSGELHRFFKAVGKPYYRPPECYIPDEIVMDVMPPAGSRPGGTSFVRGKCEGQECLLDALLPAYAVPTQRCIAKACGYVAPPIDVFACGVCLFIMATGSPIFREAKLSDSHFKWFYVNGIAKLLTAWGSSVGVEAQDLLARMLQPNPAERPTIRECLAHTWFSPFRNDPVPVRFERSICHGATFLDYVSLPLQLPLGLDLLSLPCGLSEAEGFSFPEKSAWDFAY